jgi:peptide/nickel transport system ATP-binding protein
VALLEVDRLDLSLDERNILKSLSFSVSKSEILGLVGESGAGKSMASLAIMQLLPQGARLAGDIRLDGKSLIGKSDAEMGALRGHDIGMVFQEPMTALNPVMTIGDQVAETVRIHTKSSRREARSIARRTLDRVGLTAPEFSLDRYPHELSGGQRQRVVIAIAVALAPKFLIADEPATALDVTTQAQLLELLKGLVREGGMGLLLVTHDLAVVAETADRVAILKDGEIVEEGETVPLFRSPQHPYTRTLLADATRLPARRSRTLDGAAPILEVRNIVRDYPRTGGMFSRQTAHRAVDDVSFAVAPGEKVGLVGESGSGKSTLLRTILALETPQEGEVRLEGRSFTAARGAELRRLRRRIQVVFQDPYGSFDPRQRVERLVAEPLHLLDDPPEGRARRARVEALLERVGLSASDADRFAHEFSGGQRQRIAIARALIAEPALIALDEPVSALDVTIRAQILDLLAELSNRFNVSYLFVSHDLSVVRAITDRVLVMRKGRIVEEGPTERVFASPQHPYTASLIAATPNLERALEPHDDKKAD